MEDSIDFKDLNLPDILFFLMSDSFSPAEIRRELRAIPKGSNMSTRDIARMMFRTIYEKFMQCSKKERRSIARSDIEFIYIMKHLVIRKFQLINRYEEITAELEQEIYQNNWISTPLSDIPKIPRSNELLWSSDGDPIVERTAQDKERETEILNVLYAVWDNVHELYPHEYAKAWPIFMGENKKWQYVINTVHKETSDILLHEKGEKFYNVVIPWITNLVINNIAEVCSLGRKSFREMYTQVLNVTWNNCHPLPGAPEDPGATSQSMSTRRSMTLEAI
jgi:hypothetical protein